MHNFILHVKTATCFGYTCLTTFKMDIET